MACFSRRQAGVALLSAMLIVVLAATIAVNLAHDEKFTMRKTAYTQNSERALAQAMGLEDFVRIYLRKDRTDTSIDSLAEDWATTFAEGEGVAPIEGGYVMGRIEDEQGKFNLNSLLNSAIVVSRFSRLCDNLGVDNQFIPALMDWIDPDFDVRYPDGMEDNYEYYRVANREMTDISELLLVHHMTDEIYAALKPFITALPATAGLNVNTMSAELYRSLDDNLNSDLFVEEQPETPFNSAAEFISRMQLGIVADGLMVQTEYFRAFGDVVQGDHVLQFNTLIHRNSTGATEVINRTLGSF